MVNPEGVIDLTSGSDDDVVFIDQEVQFISRKPPPRPQYTPSDYNRNRLKRPPNNQVPEYIDIDDEPEVTLNPASAVRAPIAQAGPSRAGPSQSSRPSKRQRLEPSRLTPSGVGSQSYQASSSKRMLPAASLRQPQSLPRTPPPPPLPPRQPSPEVRYFHDILDEEKWKPLHREHRVLPRERDPESDNEEEDEENGPYTSEDMLALKRRRPLIVPPYARFRPTVQLEFEGRASWFRSLTAQNDIRRARWTRAGHRRVSFEEMLGFGGLKETYSYNECPGSILRIAQSEGNVVIGGACDGGQHLNEGESPPTDPGALQIYNKRPGHGGHKLLGFAHREEDQHRLHHSDMRYKYYAINDVKCVPGSSAFVASGYDHRVRIVKEVEGEYREAERYRLQRFTGVPHDIWFKPDTTTCAVGEQDLHVFNNIKVEDHVFYPSSNEETVPSTTKISLVPPRLAGLGKHAVGAFRWGSGVTASHIFASTEPCSGQNEGSLVGYHKAIDPRSRGQRAILYDFDAKEAGDAMAVNPTGDILALTTLGEANTNILRLYDVRNKNGAAQVKINLEPYETNFEAEVHDMSYSPDGMFLALARQDNSIHVYDSRFLTKGPLSQYKHDVGIPRTDGLTCAGVMKVEWVESVSSTFGVLGSGIRPPHFSSSRLGLITGGSDGCVRLWDPLLAPDDDELNGHTLVKIDSDIATFSLGDRFKGEHQLVVGGGTGSVTIYDRLHMSREIFEED
ncbi:WD40-repeat-containing domain protein [Coprinopsis sp. MPI-PUGE-AT-0042]|nr:WD40-repeat-containing domain protein [Coprinopsis sp. MPI-PUGE-AT-0042]